MNRRGFLGAILAASMAPAIARSGVLMPIYAPKVELIRLWRDGIHDDTQALQALFDGKPVIGAEVVDGRALLSGGVFRISSTVFIGHGGHQIVDSRFIATPKLKGPMFHIGPSAYRNLKGASFVQ